MATAARPALAQWQRMETVVQAWLKERQHLLYLLCAVQGIRGLTANQFPVHHRLRQLCQVLIDYISTGYFEVYQQLAREARSLDKGDARLVEHILQQLEDSTDEALAFNEDFDSQDNIAQLLDQLPARLSQLLEKLEERFALEDQLIISVHQRSGPEAALLH